MKSTLYRIKENKTLVFKQWCEKLSTQYKSEAIETIKEEKVQQELFLFFTVSDRDYVVTFIEGEHLPSTDKPLNKMHKNIIIECLERVTSGSLLYHLKNE